MGRRELTRIRIKIIFATMSALSSPGWPQRSLRVASLVIAALMSLTVARALNLGGPPIATFTPQQVYYNNLFANMFPYLTAGQRLEFENALYPTLDQRPDLVAQGVGILQEGGSKANGTSASDGVAYIKKFLAYEARLRQAMMVRDKGVGLIFNQIDEHRPRLTN